MAPPPPLKPRRRLAELDALRGLGALLVINFHFSTRFHELFPDAGHVPFTIGGGGYRVLLFFAISGFAIFFTTQRMESAADFVVSRFVRLFPAYWMAIALTLGIEHAGNVTQLYIPTHAALVNTTMLQGFFFVPPVDGAYWTLTVELAFYACVLALWMTTRLVRVERLIAGWLLFKLAFVLWLPDLPERLVMLLVLRYVCWFAIGMASYRVWAGERRWKDQAPLLALILLTVAISETWDVILFTALLMATFWAMVEGRLGWICVRPLIWVGQISYSLYLVHQHIGFTIMLRTDAAGWPPAVGYALAIAAAIVLGFAVNRYVERPCARHLSALWQRWKAHRAQRGLMPAPAASVHDKGPVQ